MPTSEKRAVVEEVTEKLQKARGVVLTNYRGLTADEMNDLRRRLREAGVEYKVLKNTLTRIAVREAGIEPMDDILTGPTAIAFGYEDPVLPAKVLKEFSSQHDVLEIKGGLLAGERISTERVTELAGLPGREVLLGSVLAGMQAPIRGLVNVLSGVTRNLVYALDAIRRQKEEAEA